MAKTFEDLAKKAKPYLPDVPLPVLVEVGKRVLDDFCTRTLILKVNADSITLAVADSDYAITFGANNYTPLHIVKATLGLDTLAITNEASLELLSPLWESDTANRPTHLFLTFDNQVRVYPIPVALISDTLSLKMVVTYNEDVSVLDDFLMDNYWRTLVDGIIAECRDLPDRPFTEYGLADRYRLKYEKSLAQIRWAVMKSFGLGSIEVTPVSFEGY